MTNWAAGDGASTAALGWQAVIPIGSSVTLPPDPHIMDAIGGNHRLETAVADLVDNSLDAGASRVLVRFVVADNRVQSFYVVDNGRGISREQIDGAMTVGGVRTYGTTEMGHFGLGLKAASFSQADSLTVISIAEDSPAVGRRWLTSKARSSFECDVVGYGFCRRELKRDWGFVNPSTGTIIRWDAIRVFPTGHDARVVSRFIQDATTRLQHHLAMVFHRFLEQNKIRIGIDVEDVSMPGIGPVVEVKPIDPFAYLRPGAGGYPTELRTTVDGSELIAVCHIWPARSQQPQFRLPGAAPEHFQGLYFYRRDRLLQAGGWNNVEVQRRELQLARVAIDLDDALVTSRAFRMNPEKSRVESGHEFSEALDRAVAEDGTTFPSYIEAARQTFTQSNQRRRTRAQVVPLGRGVPPHLRRTVERELSSLPGYEDVDLRWRNFADDMLFDIDRDANTIWLNSRYRAIVGRGGQANLNDAPLVKTLLFLLVEGLFHGSYWGPKDRDNLELWQTLLTAAVKEELK
jgi:hypothetical protein